MLTNRSMPMGTVIPVLAYADVSEAAAWLFEAFGFTVRLRIGNHRIQLNAEDGAVVLTESSDVAAARGAVMVRVEDVDAHHKRASHTARAFFLGQQTFLTGSASTPRSTSPATSGPSRNPSPTWTLAIGAGNSSIRRSSLLGDAVDLGVVG